MFFRTGNEQFEIKSILGALIWFLFFSFHAEAHVSNDDMVELLLLSAGTVFEGLAFLFSSRFKPIREESPVSVGYTIKAFKLSKYRVFTAGFGILNAGHRTRILRIKLFSENWLVTVSM